MLARLAGVADRSWPLPRVVAIAGGGAVGATSRWAFLAAVPRGGSFPWNVLVVNVAGSLILGALLAEEWRNPRLRLLLIDAGAIGFCGGLTTFSTYSVGVVDLLDRHRVATAAIYTIASVLATLVAVLAGAWALRSWRAAGRPVDEAP
ncbi:MAG: camphor resistance protein CrcB [Acidimicrobiales bacterium]|nr:camphor resistance protein CrcB [Acidimicrobiales bacterium]